MSDNSIQKALLNAKIKANEALKLYEEILRNFPQNIEAREARNALNTLKNSTSNKHAATKIINEIISLYKAGQFTTALEKALNATREYPEEWSAWNILGAIYKGLGNAKEATIAFAKVTALDPTRAEGFNNLGTALMDFGNIDQALVAYEKAIIINPNYAEAYNNIGLSYSQHGHLTEAIEAHKTAVTINPNYAEAFCNLGAALQKSGKTKEAIVAYEKAILLKSNYVEALSNLGLALQSENMIEEAISVLNKAILHNPKHVEAYNNKGLALQKRNEFDQAINAYQTAISIKPDYVDALLNLGITLYDQGKIENAIEAFHKILSYRPDYFVAHYKIALAFSNFGKHADAVTAYSKALEIEPNYADAYNNLGVSLKYNGQIEDAIVAYEKALKLKPNYVEAHNNLGVARQELGQLDQAVIAYEKAIEIDPNYASAYYNKGLALKSMGKPQDACKAYEKALQIKPDYYEAYNNMGIAYKDQGDFRNAILAYNEALSIQPEYAQAHVNLAFALLKSGRIKKGLHHYEWRWKNPTFLSIHRQFKQPMWDGKQSLKNKTLFLWCEQGVADNLNWASRIRLFGSHDVKCKLECPEKLVPLLARSLPHITVEPEDVSRDPTRKDFDFHLPMGSICKHFTSAISQKRLSTPHLIPDPERVKYWKTQLGYLGNGPFVGFSWKSANMSDDRLQNYASISDWLPVLTISGICFVNLQYCDFADDLTLLRDKFGVHVHNFDELDHLNNLDDVSALCAALDVVISIKNTIPFISAGVGTPTKLATWRQSAWNNTILNPAGPHVELFERDTDETWENVFKSIADDINTLKNNTDRF